MTFGWLFLGMGVITFAIRLAMLLGQFEMPTVVQRALRYVPFAVLSAIIAPELLLPAPNNALNISLGNARLLAGVIAIVVAARTHNVLLTIIVGMVTLWLLLWLHG